MEETKTEKKIAPGPITEMARRRIYVSLPSVDTFIVYKVLQEVVGYL